MSRAGSQERTLLGLVGRLQPRWTRDAALPAAIEAMLRADRRLGARDRRLYRELLYTALRYRPWVEPLLGSDSTEAVRRIAWLAAGTPAVAPFRSEIAAGLPPCPPGVDEKARILGEGADALTPEWFRGECPGALSPPLRETLLSRAPLWIRLQAADPGPVLLEFEKRGWPWRRSPLLAGAILLPAESDALRTDAFREGRIEIQDVGSQLVLETAGVPPGGHWLDACAGAGGKTLQLASMLGPGGRVGARDPRPAALAELARRAARAGLAGAIEIAPRGDPAGGYDGVLVDAPCSGSGTWRRSPHLRWVTTAAAVRSAASLQLRLLRENAPLVRPGGLLVYATCSLCRTENESVVEAFLGAEPGVRPALAGKRLMPEIHDGDGFFVATFRRT
ncbi:MAG TPA: RsmB/NOP family class I SAM-dependent RNA methyltransferase [Opitutaceae bacterium]